MNVYLIEHTDHGTGFVRVADIADTRKLALDIAHREACRVLHDNEEGGVGMLFDASNTTPPPKLIGWMVVAPDGSTRLESWVIFEMMVQTGTLTP